MPQSLSTAILVVVATVHIESAKTFRAELVAQHSGACAVENLSPQAVRSECAACSCADASTGRCCIRRFKRLFRT